MFVCVSMFTWICAHVTSSNISCNIYIYNAHTVLIVAANGAFVGTVKYRFIKCMVLNTERLSTPNSQRLLTTKTPTWNYLKPVRQCGLIKFVDWCICWNSKIWTEQNARCLTLQDVTCPFLLPTADLIENSRSWPWWNLFHILFQYGP